jgi:hypothetical protein
VLRRVKRPAAAAAPGTGWLLVRLMIGHRLLLLLLLMRRSREPVRGWVGRGALLLRIHPVAVAVAAALELPMVVISILER